MREERCRRCGHLYGRTRPKCMGDECAQERVENRELCGVCVYCCYLTLHPRLKRQPYIFADNPLNFLCVWCGRELPLAIKCDCCANSIYCAECCEGMQHNRCCKVSKTIIFRNAELFFLHPSPKTEKWVDGLAWLRREGAYEVLTKRAPAKSIDPRGFVTNSSRRYASVEIEVYSYKNASELNKTLGRWECGVVRDGSIFREHMRNRPDPQPDKTFEINTTPACGDALVAQLKDITKALEKAQAQVTTSCGLHVHVDCRDYGYQEIQKLVKVYAHIEEALFAAVHWTRYANDFCKHCGDTYFDSFIKGIKPDTKNLKPALIKSIYGEKCLEITPKRHGRGPSFYDVRADHYGRNGLAPRNENRYSALNLHSYFFRGTVESRIHHGAVDFDEIYNWAKLHIDLFDIIYKTPENVLNKVLEVSRAEVDNAKELIQTDKIRRTLDKDKAALGVAVLGSLLPDDTFQAYLDKVKINCLDDEVSIKKILPCQKGKVLPKELLPANVPQPNLDQAFAFQDVVNMAPGIEIAFNPRAINVNLPRRRRRPELFPKI